MEPASVLIVEDERIFATDLQQTLRAMGYDAFAIAASAAEAVACASERRPNMVLCDVRIEGELDGTETAAILRRQFDVPVVFLTAHADDETLERAKHSEPYGYLVKPIKHVELRTAIEISLHRHAIERRLRERERWFSTTLESITDAVVTTGATGRVSFMNATAETLTGVKQDDAIGRPAHEIVVVRESGVARLPIDEALATRIPVKLAEAELVQASSAHRIISDGAAPVIDGDELLGAVMVFHDITERRLVQKRLELSERLAALGTMAATVGHEINSPLAVVVANASYARVEITRLLFALRRASPPTEETLKQLAELLIAAEETHSSASHIGRIVADLNAFARPVTHTPGRAIVARAIEWAVRLTSHELRNRAIIAVDVAPVPPATIDEGKLGQVLVNLLLNAAYAITPGNHSSNKVIVSARHEERGIVVAVHDTGCGMPADITHEIFERFFTTKPDGMGTGLGLAVCRELVEAAGGAISVASEVGVGSTFRVVLPVAPDSIDRREIATVKQPPLLSRRGRILAIDDEELVLSSIQRILDGHEVVCTTSARTALEMLLEGEPFDIIFSDLGMPNMSGIDLYERLLQVKPESAHRIVFLTGGATTARGVTFLATVPNRKLEKPADLEKLALVVQQILETSRR